MNESSTTEIIRRRVRHWKTTIAGIATILGPILIAFFPEHAQAISMSASSLTGIGLIAAADAKVKEAITKL